MDAQLSKDESAAVIEASSEDAVVSSSESWSDSDDESHASRSRQIPPPKNESESEEESGSQASSSDDSDDESHSSRSRQTPLRKNAADRQGLPYVTQLPRHERRRLKLEKKKPAFTLANVSKVLEGVDSERLCDILDISRSKRRELKTFPDTEQRREEAIKFWMTSDPLASWRRLVDQLYNRGEYALGDSIRHYCEDLTDPNSTLTNLTQVLSSVSTRDLPDYLSIPPSVSNKICEQSQDEGEQRQQFILYYLRCSPYSTSWTFLAQELHYGEPTTAKELVQKFVQSRPEPTLTTSNLSNVIEGVKDVDSVAQFLGIPGSKISEMKQKNPNKRDHCREVATYYTTSVPGASWLGVADALWTWSDYAPLETVNTVYLKGTSESRRILEASMKQGYVDAFIDKMLFHGSAGVGKTCTQRIVAGEDPPDVRTSTPVATRPVTIYQLQATKDVWEKYESDDRMKLCARISKTVIGKEIIETLQSKESPQRRRRSKPKASKAKDEASAIQVEHKEDKSPQVRTDQETPGAQEEPLSTEKAEVSDDVIQVIHNVLDKMYKYIDEAPEGVDPITYLHKVRIVDCGGQPQFHEILPIFLRKLSVIVFVVNLSEELSSRPTIEFYEDGKPLGEPYESDYTTEQLLKQGLRSIHSHRSNKDSEGESPRIVVVGTHKDLEKECKETRDTKNQKLREMLLPSFSKDVVYSQPGNNDVIFAMNAKEPGKEEEAVASAIRQMITAKRQSEPRQLPLMWLTLEIILEEITKKLDRGVLTMRECREIAYRLRFDESTLEAALIYFDELSLIFYYRDILPGLVFTNPQVVLGKISELVKIRHKKMLTCHNPSMSVAWQQFYHHALITLEFLAQQMFNEHYVPGIFEPEHVVLLYRKLLIFADYSDGKIFVPSLLRMLGNEEVSKKRVALDSPVAPLVLHFPDGPPRRGIFCALVSFLTSPDNRHPCPWKILMPERSLTPTCLYRNCVQFAIPASEFPCSVTLIDTLLQFEIHLSIPIDESPSIICPSIKQAITTGLHKANIALHYTNSTPAFALICPCGKGDCHHAIIRGKYWICSLDERMNQKLSPNQCTWVDADQQAQVSVDTTEANKKGPHSPSVSRLQVATGATAADTEVTLEEVSAQAGVKRKECLQHECSQRSLLQLAKFCVDWRLIAFHLHLTEADVAAVDEEYRTVDEKRIGMLLKWKDRGAYKSTYKVFIEALLNCGRVSDAVDACKALSECSICE